MPNNKIKYNRLILTLTVLLLICNVRLAYAQVSEQQQIDSLKTLITIETNKEKQVHTYNHIAYLFAGETDDSAFFYINKALQLAKRIDYKKGLIECYLYNARCYNQTGQPTEAITNYKQSLKLSLEIKDSINILQNYRGLSYIYSYEASQFVSLDYNIKALEYAEHLNDSASLSVIYNNIATIYKKLDNYESALFYFEKSLEIDSKIGSSTEMAVTRSNMGTTKVEHGMLKEAEVDYQILRELLPAIKSDYLQAYFHLSFAAYYTGIEKYDSSAYYITLAKNICENRNYPRVETRLYRREGEMHFKQKKYRSCISSLDQCIKISNSLGIAQEFPAIYKMKAKANSELANFKEAFLNSQQAHAFTDSLQNKKIAGSLAEFEKEQKIKLEIARNKLVDALLVQQTENSTIRLQFKFRMALIISILLLIAGTIATYSFIRLRKNNNTLQQQHTVINEQKSLIEKSFNKLQLSEKSLHKMNAAKDKLFSIIAHDLRSPFNAILGFSTELHESYDSYDNEQRKSMLGLISTSSESTLFLLDNLLNWARAQSESIQIEKDAHLLKYLVDESITPYLGSAEIKGITAENTIPEAIKVWCDKATIKVVLSNLFNNAIKFSTEQGKIQISAEIIENSVVICIADEGIGMNKEIQESLFNIEGKAQRPGTSNEKGTGLGLILCQEFIETNKGEIWVESEENNGSKFYFSLPYAKEQTS